MVSLLMVLMLSTPAFIRANQLDLHVRVQEQQKQTILCAKCECSALHRDQHNALVRSDDPAMPLVKNEVLVINCTSGLDEDWRYLSESADATDSVGAKETWLVFRARNMGTIFPLLGLLSNLNRLSLANSHLEDIRANTFSNLVNLRQLDLSFNQIAKTSPHALRGLVSLERLDLSHNRLGHGRSENSIPRDLLAGLPNLTHLNLRNNSFSGDINSNTFPGSESLSLLDLSHNEFTSIAAGAWKRVLNITRLDLSWNRIKSLAPDAFVGLDGVERLDLSHNELTSGLTSTSAFLQLKSLLELDVSQCSLGDMSGVEGVVEVAFELPSTVTQLRVSSSKLTEFHPRSWGGLHELQRLDISGNSIGVLEDIAHLDQLQELNVSHNALVRFPRVNLLALEVLDMSYNELEVAPDLSPSLTPRLVALTLDGNPFEEIHMHVPWTLRILSAKHMPRLVNLPENALFMDTSVASNASVSSSSQPGRLALWLSHNPVLRRVHSRAFDGLPLYQLDLSYNALSWLPEELAHWDTLDVIDLQGNPWACSCSLQWLLDTLIPIIYHARPDLLQDVKCASPTALANRRLVHWYLHSGSTLCVEGVGTPEDQVLRAGLQAGYITVTLGVSGAGLAIIVGSSVAVLSLAVVGMIAHRRHIERRRQRNRRL